jgi:hypothetical protein
LNKCLSNYPRALGSGNKRIGNNDESKQHPSYFKGRIRPFEKVNRDIAFDFCILFNNQVIKGHIKMKMI